MFLSLFILVIPPFPLSFVDGQQTTERPSSVSRNWCPPLPKFMDRASEESKKQFQLIINDPETDITTKRRLLDDFIANQPEVVREAYNKLFVSFGLENRR